MTRNRSDRERKAMFANMNSSGHKQGMESNQQVVQSQHNENLSRKVVVRDNPNNDGTFVGSKSFRIIDSKPLITKKPFGSSHQSGHIDRKPKLSKVKLEFISKEIRRQRKERKPEKQSIAIAFSKARKKFGNSTLRQMPNNPNNDNKEQKRIRRLLVSLFGLAITLEILRRVRLQSSHKSGHTDNDRNTGHTNNKKPSVIKVKKTIQIPPVLTVSDVKRINREAGQFFFSPESMKFFESRIETRGLLIKNRFFVTSEQFISSTGEKSPRKFTVRELNRETGGIITVSKFNSIPTKKEAIEFAEKQ